MQRRTFLAGSAAVASAVVGGCLGSGDDARTGVILTHVELGNATADPQVFDVLVTQDDEIIHWATHEVGVGAAPDEAGGKVIELDPPAEPGAVEVHARVGENWQRTGFTTDEFDGERVIAVVTYGMGEAEALRISRRHADRSPAGTA